MNLKDEIKSERRLITVEIDKLNEANLNMPNVSTTFSHKRSSVNSNKEITNPFKSELSHQQNNGILMKKAPQLKEWPTFTGEGQYDHMSFIMTIEMLQEDYSIPEQ
ncbi:hypothetical protein O181_061419 [Austropuccinia psidii MF-1]|uniref:Uncharacterized protein n=1 Tax=Austropuccinia psidii MF-1 TaxID=1389203 RepID=A0A9Q3EIB7_9BASI|nr:hypothetical protein [Austropuccinia psidii MF-1]